MSAEKNPPWRYVAASARTICISGGIGAGKTTFSKNLSQLLEYTLFEEPVNENPYLADFYEDQETYAFPCQVAFLASRFSQLSRMTGAHHGIIMDRSAHEDVIFARHLFESGVMDHRDFLTYMKMFESLTENISNKVPDIIIYLDVDPKILMKRIKSRGRACEQDGGVTEDYIRMLQVQYERYIKEMGKHSAVFRVAWDTFGKVDEVWTAVHEQYTGKHGLFVLQL